jgi:hypothetical protein
VSAGYTKRGKRRVIDMLPVQSSGSRSGLDPTCLQMLERLWPKLERKAAAAHIRTCEPELRASTQRPRFSGEEIDVMAAVLMDLMAPLDSDTRRRRQRDLCIALDYHYHKTIRRDTIVMPGLCARWDVPESIAKSAIRREGAVAKDYIAMERKDLDKLLGDRSGAYLADQYASLTQELSTKYRDGSMPSPRRRRGGNKSR